MDSAGFIILIAWILAVPLLNPSTFEASRVPVFVCVLSVAVYNIFFLRSQDVLQSISIGLNGVLSIIYAANLMLLNDVRRVRRLVLRRGDAAIGDARRGTVHEHRNEHGNGEKFLDPEAIPHTFLPRLFWTLDLITSLRGTHWLWHPSETSTRQASLEKALLQSHKHRALLVNIARFALDYLILDITKCLILADPYFNGSPATSTPPPPHIIPFIAQNSKFALYTYRTLLATLGVTIAIEIEYTLARLVFVGVLGPLGLVNEVIASPAVFPGMWGSPSAVCRKGLRGFWGETWHQIFRRHFVGVGDGIADLVVVGDGDADAGEGIGKGERNESMIYVAVRTTTVFLLSGVLHAAASHTLRGPTHPFRSFLSFALQPLGIAVQSLCSYMFVERGFAGSFGRMRALRYIANTAFTLVWLWATMGMVLDDLTRGQMWMIEPVPVSFVRGVGGFADGRYRRW